MTLKMRLSETDCITIAGIDHRLLRQTSDGVILARADAMEISRAFGHDEFLRLLAAPDVHLRRGHFSATRAALRLRHDVSYLNTLPKPRRDKVLWQSTLCTLFLDAETRGEVCRSEAAVSRFIPALVERANTMEIAAQELGQKGRAGDPILLRRSPSVRTLLQWVRLYERAERSPLALLRKHRANLSHSRLAADSERLLCDCVQDYLSFNRPTRTMIVDETRTRFIEVNAARMAAGLSQLPIPSERTVRRRIARLDPFEVMAQREGLESARRRFGFHEAGIRADHPMQRIEMDEWEIDVLSLFDQSGALDPLNPSDRARFDVGRRWLYVAIDCATRCVVSLRLAERPLARAAIEALSLIVRDKTSIAQAAGCQGGWAQHGGIGSLVTDQGSAFAALDFRAAVTDLGATYEAPPAGVPKLRSRIERVFGTFGQQLAPMLIGRTFSNIAERGDYPSEQWAVLTDDDLAQILTLFVVDIYHNQPHKGLGGETPANAWKRLVSEQGVTPPPDANHQRAVFGIPLMRIPKRHGVQVFGIHFTCPELQAAVLRGLRNEVQIRVDPTDLSHVSVCLSERWYPAQAVSNAVAKLSLEEWQTIVRDLRTQNKQQAVIYEPVIAAARKKIKALDADARELRRVKPRQLSQADLDRAERDLFVGLQIGPEGSAAADPANAESDALFADVIQARQQQAASLPAGNGPEPHDANWKFSDD